MKSNKLRISAVTLAFLLVVCLGSANALQVIPDDWELNEIELTDEGFLRKTAGDPFIIFPEIEEQICELSGIQFTIKLDPMPEKPMYMELFWRPTYEGFGEDRKVFFIVQPNKNSDTINFTVPLDQQGGFKQIRLDLPGDLDSTFQIEKYSIVTLSNLPEGSQLVDSYFRLSASAAQNPAIIIPYIAKTLRHGMVRMSRDPVFLVFWLLMITALLAAHRFLIRFPKHQSPSQKK